MKRFGSHLPILVLVMAAIGSIAYTFYHSVYVGDFPVLSIPESEETEEDGSFAPTEGEEIESDEDGIEAAAHDDEL